MAKHLDKTERNHFTYRYGEWITKRSYGSFRKAIIECNKMNVNNNSEFKALLYVCESCGKIHIGKDKTVLNDLNLKFQTIAIF
jgi:hypothetical protein